MRRLILKSVVAAMLAIAPLAQADARSDAAHAQRHLAATEHRLHDLHRAIEHARLSVNAAISRQQNAAYALSAAQAQVNASATAINDAQSKIAALAETARAAATLAEQRRTDFDAAKNRLDEASRATEKYRAEAIGVFESSPAFTLAASELASASTAYQAEVDASLGWLYSTDVYADTWDFVEEMAEEVEAMRALVPPNPPALAAASQAWIDAKNQLSALKNDFLSRDADVTALRQNLELAQSRRKALVDRFNQDLAADQNLKRLTDTVAAEQAVVAAAAHDINAANEQRVTAENGLAQLQAFINTEQSRLEQAQRDVASCGTFADSSWYEINHAQAELARLCDLERFAHRDHELAAADLRRTIERADADHVRREIEERRDRDHREATLAAAHERGGRSSFVDIGASQRAETERRARTDAEQRERERKEAFERERRQRESEPKPSNPNPSPSAEDQRRIAAGEAAVARRQAIEARETTVPQRPAPENDDSRAARERAAQEARDSRARQAQENDQRADAQRKAHAEAERVARERSAREAQSQREAKEQVDANARAQAERESRAQAERDAKAAAARESRAQAERESKAAGEREAKASAEREARARAEREARDERAKQDQQRAEQQKQERQREEQQQRAEQQRQDRQRADQERKQQDEQRREQESRKREQDSREQQQREQREQQQREQKQREDQQREQKQRDDQQREQERRRNDDESRNRREAEQKDRDRDSKFRR